MSTFFNKTTGRNNSVINNHLINNNSINNNATNSIAINATLSGLSDAEAKVRLEYYGKNEVAREKVPSA